MEYRSLITIYHFETGCVAPILKVFFYPLP